MKVLISVGLLLGLSTSSAAETTVMRVGNVIGDPAPGEEPHHMVKTQRYFERLVAEKTRGEVEVRFLEGKSLPVFQMADMVAKGELEATNVPGFFLTRVPELDVQSIPYLFQGMEHARRFPQSKAASLLSAKIEKAYGVEVLGFFNIASAASINSKVPIRLPEDFRGKKIANIWELYRPMFQRLTPAHLREVGFTEAVEGGLVTGEFDVAIGLLQNNHGQKLYRYYEHNMVAPYLYNIYYTFLLNPAFWEKLAPGERQVIEEAAREAENAAVAFAADAAEEHFLKMAAEGVQMHLHTKAEREAWRKAIQGPVLEKFLASTPDPEEARQLILSIEELYP